jgi:hypothetical protein
MLDPGPNPVPDPGPVCITAPVPLRQKIAVMRFRFRLRNTGLMRCQLNGTGGGVGNIGICWQTILPE